MLRTRHQQLHPIAWWCWAGALAVAASRTTNPLLLGLIMAVVAWVVTTRRGNTPWARSFGALMRLGLVVIFIRVVVQVLFGDRVPGTTWFSLPSVPLPSWAAGVTIGGPVTAQAAIGAFCQGLQIAVILACFGAANSLASSFRLLRCVPAGLYEVAVAVTVAISFTPQVVLSIARVRDARRLRGRATSGLAGWRGLAVPVLEGALERSVALAASMDARGFGRRSVAPKRRQATAAATLGGLVGLGIGLFEVLYSGSASGIGIAVALVGGALVIGGLLAASHGSKPLSTRPLAGRRVARRNCGPRGRRRSGGNRKPRPERAGAAALPSRAAGRPGRRSGRHPGGRRAVGHSPHTRAPACQAGRGPRVIAFDRVTVTYPDASVPALEDVSLTIEEGHLALVIGATGSGKSTLLRCVNGLVPHFSGGRLNGTVTVDGRSTEQYRPRDLADAVGYVGQDPDATFVADTVEDELAYAMENLGMDPATMRRRVEDVLDTSNLQPRCASEPSRRCRAVNVNVSPSAPRSPPRLGRSCSTSRPRRSTPSRPKRCSRRFRALSTIKAPPSSSPSTVWSASCSSLTS